MEENIMFNSFYVNLYTHYLNYTTLLYGNFLSIKELWNENDNRSEYYQTQIFETGEHLDLNHSHIVQTIKSLSKIVDQPYETTMIYLFNQDNAGLKARAINAYYEWIKKYLLFRGKKEIFEFHSYDWFRVLYVLRNVTSHADNVGYKVEFPDRSPTLKSKIQEYPDTITWGKISIVRGQEDEVVYSEVQIRQLMIYIMSFFVKNKKFNPDILDNQSFQKSES